MQEHWWNYKITICPINVSLRSSQEAYANCQERIKHLDRHGEEGWELVCATIETDTAGPHWVYHWKRPVRMR